MPYLIDGFNLIYKFPDLEEMMYNGMLSEARKGLLNILKKYYNIKKSKIRVVFDGKKNPSDNIRSESSGSIDIYYSLDFSADHLIKQFIKKDPNPKMTFVVTSDREIQAFVKTHGARIIESEAFARSILEIFENIEKAAEDKAEKSPEPIVTPEDIDYWENAFKSRKK
jgi:hypothetical protein